MLHIPGYTWKGQNRKSIHVNARKGSGGIGLLIKDDIMEHFKVIVADDSYEGILWIKFNAKKCDFAFHICVCYLPPIDSCRYVNGADFFDNLLGQVYRMQNDGLIVLCGDFNARCGDMPDFIDEDVDTVCDRNVVDLTRNVHGELLCEFMLSAGMCMLNGRNYVNNDFTCQDASVVDYAIIPQEQLTLHNEFSVKRVNDLFEQAGCVGLFDPVRHMPDHNVIQWNMDISQYINIHMCNDMDNGVDATSYTRHVTSDVPDTILQDPFIMEQLHASILRIEHDNTTQQELNMMYDQFCEIIKSDMDDKLVKKTIIISDELHDKRRRIKKDYWNAELDKLYKEFRKADREWSKSKGDQRRRLKADKCAKQKLLDRAVQRAKRAHWRKMQDEILALQNDNSKEFWKYIGRIGVSKERRKKIPWEVVLPDGSLSHDHQAVLDHCGQSLETC